jgi:hypothetical protein
MPRQFDHPEGALERTAPPEMREFVVLLYLRARYAERGAGVGEWAALERQFVVNGSPHSALVCRGMATKGQQK